MEQPVDTAELQSLCGEHDVNLRLIEDVLGVRVSVKGQNLSVAGAPAACEAAGGLIQSLLSVIRRGRTLTTADVRYAVRAVQRDAVEDVQALLSEPVVITHRGKPVRPRTAGQAAYVRAMQESDLVFCVGPAGTGKTYLAMAVAVAGLRDGRLSRVVLTRPLVEAGENLGFLPGDISEKVDPYLRPLHDALHDIMGADRFRRNLERRTIEVVPLAYMRGRTLNDAFIVLDEAQNTSIAQMKMFLTRMGFGSKMVVTGDVTQTDLPAAQMSGLQHAQQVLGRVEGARFCELTGADIVRHDLVQRIVEAYERAEPERKRG